jgi:phospholipase/carboxylesterase/glyoxalase family protein
MAITHGQRIVHAGEDLQVARAAMILLHGRGATAEDIMTIASEVQHPGWAYLAPQAAGNAWYPNPFLAPLEQNQPWLDDAVGVVNRLLVRILAEGLPSERVALLGFSQGACLALEYAARHPRRYGALVGLSGGLIGPPGTSLDHEGSLAGTPAFLGCSDADPHIPKDRVVESGAALERQGAEVRVRLYPDLGHEVNEDELEQVRGMIDALGH